MLGAAKFALGIRRCAVLPDARAGSSVLSPVKAARGNARGGGALTYTAQTWALLSATSNGGAAPLAPVQRDAAASAVAVQASAHVAATAPAPPAAAEATLVSPAPPAVEVATPEPPDVAAAAPAAPAVAAAAPAAPAVAAAAPAATAPAPQLSASAKTPAVAQSNTSGHASGASGRGSGGAGSGAGGGTGTSSAKQRWWQQRWSGAILALAGVVVGGLISREFDIFTGLLAAQATTDAAKVPVQATKDEAAELSKLASTLEDRLLAGIKARILKPDVPRRRPQQVPGAELVGMGIPPLPRTAAEAMFKRMETDTTKPCVVLAQKGHGKSWAARAYASDPANPHVIYVDLAGCSSFDAAAKAVAKATGYRTTYTAEEDRAKRSGHRIKDLDTPWTKAEYDTLLKLFIRACRELREESKITDGRPVMLMLDHVTRPFTFRPAVPLDSPPPATATNDPHSLFDTLIYQTLETAKLSQALEQDHTRIALIASDPTGELPSWKKPTIHDNLYEALLPAFTQEEAEELLARCIYFKRHPDKSRDTDPDEEDVKKTKEDYASTIAFLVGALGCHARALAACFEHDAPLPDEELVAKGAGLPDTLLAFLPKELPDTVHAKLKLKVPDASALRVDATALAAVKVATAAVQAKVEELLFLPPDIVLAPSTSPPPAENGQRIVRRVLDVDAALRALLAAGTMNHERFAAAFRSSKHLAPVLAEKHLVFYHLVSGTVEFESAMVQRAVAAVLNGPQHAARKELAQKLLEWQLANAELEAARAAESSTSQALTDAMKLWEAEKADKTWYSWQQPSEPAVERKVSAAADRDAAAARRKAAEADLKAKADRIAQLRPLVPSSAS